MDCDAFNQDISKWDTSKVATMKEMFRASWPDARSGPMAFNQDISKWYTSRVVDFFAMFYHATSFAQDISGWNLNSAGSGWYYPSNAFSIMFEGATAFQAKFECNDANSGPPNTCTLRN